jgi:hypothetical protein
MKWTIRELQSAFKFRDEMGATDDEIAKALGRSVGAIRNKIGCNPKGRRRHFASHDADAAARVELRRALSAPATKRKRHVAVREQESFQVHRIRRVAQARREYVEQPAAGNNPRSIQTRDPVA